MTRSDVFILGLLLGAIILYLALRSWKNYKLHKYLRRARKGEKKAISFLEGKGYTIIGIQERKTFITRIDGNPRHNHLTVDLLAKKHGKIYVVEVKTGKKSSKPLLAGTRRQLLEYFLVFRPYGVLLLDMEKSKLHEISFEICDDNSQRGYLIFLITGILGLFCGWFLYKFSGGGI